MTTHNARLRRTRAQLILQGCYNIKVISDQLTSLLPSHSFAANGLVPAVPTPVTYLPGFYTGTNLYWSQTEAQRCEQFAQGCYTAVFQPGRLKIQDLENAGPNNFTSCWVCINSLNNKLIPNCVLTQTAHKWKRSKIVMQKVNPCAQRNEILVHKGHKHENHSKLCVF